MRVALKKQDEIKSIIEETIVSEEESVLQCAGGFQFTGVVTLLHFSPPVVSSSEL